MDAFQLQHHACCIITPSPPTVPTLSSGPATGYQTVYLFMDESRGVPQDTVIDGKPSTEPNSVTYQLPVILIEMCSTTLVSQWWSLPWNPPHTFLSVKGYLDYYRGNTVFLDFWLDFWTRIRLFSCFPTNVRPIGSTSLTVALIITSSKQGERRILSRNMACDTVLVASENEFCEFRETGSTHATGIGPGPADCYCMLYQFISTAST